MKSSLWFKTLLRRLQTANLYGAVQRSVRNDLFPAEPSQATTLVIFEAPFGVAALVAGLVKRALRPKKDQ